MRQGEDHEELLEHLVAAAAVVSAIGGDARRSVLMWTGQCKLVLCPVAYLAVRNIPITFRGLEGSWEIPPNLRLQL